MRLAGRFAMFLLWLPGPALARSLLRRDSRRAALPQRDAGGGARRGIPNHLLAAMGRVESGRRDPVTGDWYPWPWTVNAEGASSFYDTKAQAVAAVRAMQSSGMRSIDVGCMQVNLMHHPDAFATLDLAFEPRRTSATRRGSCGSCMGRPVTGTRRRRCIIRRRLGLAAEYQRKVLAVLPLESRFAVGAAPSALARAWAATMGPATGGVCACGAGVPPGRSSAPRGGTTRPRRSRAVGQSLAVGCRRRAEAGSLRRGIRRGSRPSAGRSPALGRADECRR